MLSTIPGIGISKRPRKYLNTLVGIVDADKGSYGLVFFGTPHGGPGDDWKIFSEEPLSGLPSLCQGCSQTTLWKG